MSLACVRFLLWRELVVEDRSCGPAIRQGWFDSDRYLGLLSRRHKRHSQHAVKLEDSIVLAIVEFHLSDTKVWDQVLAQRDLRLSVERMPHPTSKGKVLLDVDTAEEFWSLLWVVLGPVVPYHFPCSWLEDVPTLLDERLQFHEMGECNRLELPC